VIYVAHVNLPLRRAVEAAKQVEQGRFAGTRRAHNRDELTCADACAVMPSSAWTV
jgi:hypothetical protein